MELEIRGATAYVATGGKQLDPEKETVVFVHGVGQDHTIWVLPIRYFASHDRNVLAVDLPGHGRSQGPLLKTIEEMGEWILEMMNVAGVERASLVGQSMGSLVALDVASRHPDRVRSIALVGVSVPLAVSEPLMNSADAHSHDAIDMMTYWSHSKAGQIGGSPTPGIWMVGAWMRLLEQEGAEVIDTDLLACDEYASGLDRAAKIECPALLLLGEKDRMTPVKMAESLQNTIPDHNTVVFEGAGHALLAERSDPVLDRLIGIV